METKLFELRDEGTFIPLLCVKPTCHEENSLDGHRTNPACAIFQPAGRCSCGADFESKMAWRYGYKGSRAVIVTHMGEPRRGCCVDPYDWGDRTFQAAHLHIEEKWDELKSGDLIDVCYILGETSAPCASEA